MKTTKKVTKTDEAPRRSMYLGPWLLIPALLGLGNMLNGQIGPGSPNPRWVPIVVVLFLYTATAVLSAVTWRYAEPRGRIIQGHSVTTVAVSGLILIGLFTFGLSAPTFWVTALIGGVFAVSWNIRRMEAIKGEGSDANNKEVLAELGLSVKSKRTVIDTPDRKEVKLKLGDGQTVEDVQKVLPQLGSFAGTIRKGTRAVAGEREGEVTLSFALKDVLKETIPWPGPTHPGGSIADGLMPGLYEDGLPVAWYPSGNYRKNIAGGHLAIAGLSGTGKGIFARVTIADLATRTDVWISLSDTRKGKQFVGPLQHAIGWYVDTEPGVKQQLKAIERAMDARNRALGEAGYENWTPEAFTDPRLRMPAVVHWMEEAAAVLDDNPRVIVELGEACRSAGIFLVFSAQRWSNDRMPTSLRYNIANAVCYGVGDDVSATMVLSDSTLKAGPDPYEWRARFPGRGLIEGNGIDVDRFPVPWKTFMCERQQAQDVIEEWAPRMAQLDSVTRAAFGDVYEQRTKPTAAVAQASVDDEDLGDYGEEEEKYMIPEQPDPEMAATVNPRDELPAWDGPENDLSPEPQPGERKLTPDQRRVAFAEMIGQLMEDKRTDVTMSELVDEWDSKVGPSQANQRPFLHEQLNVWIDLGQIERVAEGRGRYRLLAAATVGAHAP